MLIFEMAQLSNIMYSLFAFIFVHTVLFPNFNVGVFVVFFFGKKGAIYKLSVVKTQ